MSSIYCAQNLPAKTPSSNLQKFKLKRTVLFWFNNQATYEEIQMRSQILCCNNFLGTKFGYSGQNLCCIYEKPEKFLYGNRCVIVNYGLANYGLLQKFTSDNLHIQKQGERKTKNLKDHSPEAYSESTSSRWTDEPRISAAGRTAAKLREKKSRSWFLMSESHRPRVAACKINFSCRTFLRARARARHWHIGCCISLVGWTLDHATLCQSTPFWRGQILSRAGTTALSPTVETIG